MTKMGGSPPHFEGKNFAYWKVRMAAYLDAIAPEVWLATKTGFTGTPTTEQLKWNAKARNAIFEAISEEVFARVNGMDLASDIWKELIEIHEGSTKVREQKYHLFRVKYDSFKMLPHENCNDMYSRLNIIVKDINALEVSKIDVAPSTARFSCSFRSPSTISSMLCFKRRILTQWKWENLWAKFALMK